MPEGIESGRVVVVVYRAISAVNVDISSSLAYPPLWFAHAKHRTFPESKTDHHAREMPAAKPSPRATRGYLPARAADGVLPVEGALPG